MVKDERIKTDVLVIGGGMAGCFAAIKAKEQGSTVTLVDKGYVSSSGQTPFANAFAVFSPEWGHDLDAWLNQVNEVGEYINNLDWTRTVFNDSYDRYEDLKSWGATFKRESGNLVKLSHLGVHEALDLQSNFPEILRKKADNCGVNIVDRLMVVDLLKQDDRVVGAVGFPVDGLDFHIFEAKSTVLCTGAAGFKPPGWPIHELTADGHVMAYRIGAEITGKEFVDSHITSAEYPAYVPGIDPVLMGPPEAKEELNRKTVNAHGEEVPGIGTLFLEHEFEAHAGRAPIYIKAKKPGGSSEDKLRVVGGASSGMSVHTTEGVMPVDTSCASNIPGLYAAGDSLGTMVVGAIYSGIGFALATAAVTGARAGLSAADYASNANYCSIDDDKLKRSREFVYSPLSRNGGFSPRWVTQVLQNLMAPYYIMYIKHEERLNAALKLVEFMKSHLVPNLIAEDPHELRLAHETRNMVLNAVMKLRASLFRTESRGNHYREDYPERKDPEWLAWVKLSKGEEGMNVLKEQIPEDWWPDLSKDYEERYPTRYPGEDS